MRNDGRLLLIGPGTVIGTILAAQLCARALAEWPDSSLAWYLNLQVFRPVRYGIDVLPGDGLAQSTWIAVPLLVLICIGLLLKSRLPVAIAAHLGLFYSVLILYCSESDIPSALASKRALAELQVWTGPNFLATAIFLLSLVSSAIAHREYWRDMKAADAWRSTLAEIGWYTRAMPRKALAGVEPTQLAAQTRS
jgi:hypothetical protein